MLTANLRREMVTDDEIGAQLRTQGIHDIGDIKQAYLEADGTTSVIKNDAKQSPTRPTTRRPAKKRSRSKKRK